MCARCTSDGTVGGKGAGGGGGDSCHCLELAYKCPLTQISGSTAEHLVVSSAPRSRIKLEFADYEPAVFP